MKTSDERRIGNVILEENSRKRISKTRQKFYKLREIYDEKFRLQNLKKLGYNNIRRYQYNINLELITQNSIQKWKNNFKSLIYNIKSK